MSLLKPLSPLKGELRWKLHYMFEKTLSIKEINNFLTGF